MRDADACLKLAPRFAKAHFAKGRALYFLSDYEAAFVQYDAGLRLEQHPRIAAWLEAERHKPEYATHAGPRALVRRPARGRTRTCCRDVRGGGNARCVVE